MIVKSKPSIQLAIFLSIGKPVKKEPLLFGASKINTRDRGIHHLTNLKRVAIFDLLANRMPTPNGTTHNEYIVTGPSTDTKYVRINTKAEQALSFPQSTRSHPATLKISDNNNIQEYLRDIFIYYLVNI